MPAMHLSLQILPRVPEDRLYPTVDKVIDMIRASGLPFMVGPMETTIEGEMDQLFELVKEAHRICLAEGASRIGAVIKTDMKPAGLSFDEKIGKYRDK
ncbi:thiamine-binding protein [Marispirochaeta sp.]|jgi:uncharacterized protein YqgV (UPF0045/DUF77 family)|uniref:thiamine-binding protein n=1 Tax=Marispirochaeta sp. TaxID=2038653 RepID=UPI0029C7B08F|nr:thiamine-binding protein [Marispirochaeta sp.]